MLSVAILARDEARHIAGAIASVAGLADEVLVLLDDRTRDTTAALAAAQGARVVTAPWPGFPSQRNQALALCRGDWVLFLDADERVTPELATAIRTTLAGAPAVAGYWIPRRNLFFGHVVRGGGWSPDRQLRLLRRDAARYDLAAAVHEVAQLDGPAADLFAELLHINIERLDELWRKQRAYAMLEAQSQWRTGVRARRRSFLASPLREFRRRFITLGGWRDGALGLLLCGTLAAAEWIRLVHLAGLQRALPAGHREPVRLPPPAEPPHLAVVIVSWNVRELLHRCLAACQASLAGSGLPARLVVVDNGSTDGSPAMVRANFPEVTLIEAGANLGFARGNNLGMRRCGVTGQGPSDPAAPGYVLLLNPDTEPLGDALPRMVAFMQAHPDVAVLGPQLRYGDGTLQSSRRRLPTPATYFWESTPLERLWPANPWARHYHCADRPAGQVQEVDWLVGAALLVRAAAIERAGLLDEGFFMYSEELEWLVRLGRCGRIVYFPEAVIIHHEGRSSAQVPARRHINFQRSKLRLAGMRHGPVFAAALRLFLLAGYAGDMAVEAARWLLGHRRALRAERIALYRDVLRSGL